MSDTPQSPKESISDEQLQSFLSQANAGNGCPVCSTNRWHRLMEPAHGFNYLIPSALTHDSYRGFEVVVLYCMNCGFLRSHAAHLIRAWGKDNG